MSSKATGRNLLPLLRGAGVTRGTVGEWTVLSTPEELAKLQFGDIDDDAERTRIQSIPNPWARLLLFRRALEDEYHPARKLVTNEILDAFQLIWASTSMGLNWQIRRIDLASLVEIAAHAGSVRVMDFAAALVQLAPRDAGLDEELAVAFLNGRPILGSSPYTALFTAEDAHGTETGTFFRYAHRAEYRALADRPVAFQEYVAKVILPQIRAQTAIRPGLILPIQRIMGEWLTAEVRIAAQHHESVADTLDTNWETAVRDLGLEPVSDERFGGLILYKSRPGREFERSRWRLRTTRDLQLPLILESDSFDGRYYDGAGKISLPPLRDQDRSVLPIHKVRYPWVNPSADWLTERILLLNQPLDVANVQGFADYRVNADRSASQLTALRMTLPLRAEFFRYFAPEDVDRMVTIEVLPNEEISIVLRIPLGTDEKPNEVVVRKTYGKSDILRAQPGPELALWPPFRDLRWQDYIVFRSDTHRSVADYYEIAAFDATGDIVETVVTARTPLVRSLAMKKPPAVLEFRDTASGRPQSLGVVLPRYREAHGPNRIPWSVGVDFGTSNTVISIRRGPSAEPTLFEAADAILPLTRASQSTTAILDAYFIPETLRAGPFGTAVSHLKTLPTLQIEQEPIGARVSVPFRGSIYDDGYTRVVGDLKWSSEKEIYFLSAAFLRHVLAMVVSTALLEGVDPAEITFSWAFPRAFTKSQRRTMRALWHDVLGTFAHIGVRLSALQPEVDESHSVLRYFFNTEDITTAGRPIVILDVGGGTTDIAAYGGGKVLILDSVLFGGRNLTGEILHGNSSADRINPFVSAFVHWAAENHLSASDQSVVEAYSKSGEVHLAFSYLVGMTEWFRSGDARRFTGQPAFRRFQLLVLYFYSALFYYVGLSFRSENGESRDLPEKVILAGNGSRYMDWLTDLQRFEDLSSFSTALGYALAHGAGATSLGHKLEVQVSRKAKEEVACGLVWEVDPKHLQYSATSDAPIVGEAIKISVPGSEGVSYTPEARFELDDQIDGGAIPHLVWAESPTEIERFHDAFEAIAKHLAKAGSEWAWLPGEVHELLSRFPISTIQQGTLARLQYLANRDDGFRGSLFVLEASVVLEKMLTSLFPPTK